MNTPNKCSVVLVAGSELDNTKSLNNTMVTVHHLEEQMKKSSYAIILLVDPNIDLDIDLAMGRKWRYPALVRENFVCVGK